MTEPAQTPLAIRILLDTPPPQPTDAAYLFAQTADNTPSVLVASAALLKSGMTRCLLISGSSALSGYQGAATYNELLLGLGISSEQILRVPPPDAPIMHTTNESRALLKFAHEQNYASLHIVASPLHQLRAFISAVSAAIRCKSRMRLFSAPGAPLPWLDSVIHSQGTTHGTRSDLLTGELERIERYRASGDLVGDAEVWEYLAQRDREQET